MLLHGIDIGLVEQRLVGVGLVALDPLDEFVLPHHAVLPRLLLETDARAAVDLRRDEQNRYAVANRPDVERRIEPAPIGVR